MKGTSLQKRHSSHYPAHDALPLSPSPPLPISLPFSLLSLPCLPYYFHLLLSFPFSTFPHFPPFLPSSLSLNPNFSPYGSNSLMCPQASFLSSLPTFSPFLPSSFSHNVHSLRSFFYFFYRFLPTTFLTKQNLMKPSLNFP